MTRYNKANSRWRCCFIFRHGIINNLSRTTRKAVRGTNNYGRSRIAWARIDFKKGRIPVRFAWLCAWNNSTNKLKTFIKLGGLRVICFINECGSWLHFVFRFDVYLSKLRLIYSLWSLDFGSVPSFASMWSVAFIFVVYSVVFRKRWHSVDFKSTYFTLETFQTTSAVNWFHSNGGGTNRSQWRFQGRGSR